MGNSKEKKSDQFARPVICLWGRTWRRSGQRHFDEVGYDRFLWLLNFVRSLLWLLMVVTLLVFGSFLWTVAVPAVLDAFGVDCLAEGVRTPPAVFTKAGLVTNSIPCC